MNKILLFFLFFVYSLNAFNAVIAQNIFKGNITDSRTGKGIYNASVFISELNKSINSDTSGNFFTSGIPSGLLNIELSAPDYKTIKKSIVIKNGENIFNFIFIHSSYTTDEIIVKETNTDKTYQTDKIDSRDILTNGNTNLTDAVTKLPGVWQLSTGTGVSKPVIRGLYGSRIVTLMNGTRFENMQWQDEHGLVVNENGLDRVEIIKGPKSLLYGSEAMGGVMNIIEEKPAPSGKMLGDFNLKYLTGTLGISADVGMKGAYEKLSWRLRMSGESHADYLDGSGLKIPQTRFAGGNFKGTLSYNTPLISSILDYSFTKYTYGILEGAEFEREKSKNEPRGERGFEGPHHILDVHNAAWQNSIFKGKSKFKILTGFQSNKRQEFEGRDDFFLPDSLKTGSLRMKINTFTIDASYGYQVNKNSEFIIGTQDYIQDNVNDGQRRIVPDAVMKQLSGMSYFKYNFKKLTSEIGLRYDRFYINTEEYGRPDTANYFAPLKNTYGSVTGSAGVAYRFNRLFLLKVNFSGGYRAPNLYELLANGVIEDKTKYEKGNSSLNKEENYELDIGAVIESRKFSLDLSAYYNNVNRYIYLKPAGSSFRGIPVFDFVQDNVNLKGIEIDALFNPVNSLSIRATFSSVIGKLNSGEHLPLMPADRITLELRGQIKKILSVYRPYLTMDTYTSLKQNRPGQYETPTGEYTLFNLSIGGELKFEKQFLLMAVTVKNVFNRTYTDHLSRFKPIGANNMGRNIVLSARIPFNLTY
jgi:iron complex outermembrane receptor protein